MSFLTVEDLTVSYRAGDGLRSVVDGVSFAVDAGEIVGVSGPSGSGKTTVALAILGLLPDAATVSGAIAYGGRDLRRLREHDLETIRGAEIGIVFQEPALALNPVLTAGAHVAEVVRAHSRCNRASARQRALAAMTDVGLGDSVERIYDAYPHELSGGQRQRVLIAQAIVNGPQLVIADEPTASLDAAVRAEVLALIRRLNERHGTAFLLISHNADVLTSTAHRTITIGRERTAPLARISRDVVVSRVQVPIVSALPPDTASDIVAEAVGLRKTYRQQRLLAQGHHDVTALAGADLIVKRGSTVGLTGDSGCGKSTLARCLAGLESPDAGDVRISGQSLGLLKGRDLVGVRNQVQLIFQDSAAALNPRFTALDIISEPMVVQGISTPAERVLRARDLMLQVGLPADRLQARPHEFSGGERQRLAIARALAVGARLLILDEAFSGLDAETRSRVTNLLTGLQQTHSLALLCISHDLKHLAEFASEIVVMHHGRIEERREIDTYVRMDVAVA